jgi:hypothetical protein
LKSFQKPIRLELELNEIKKAFLVLDEFLARGKSMAGLTLGRYRITPYPTGMGKCI